MHSQRLEAKHMLNLKNDKKNILRAKRQITKYPQLDFWQTYQK